MDFRVNEKMIKALNERLADFERQGLQGTREYQKLRSGAATISGGHMATSRSGNARISRSKTFIESMTPQQSTQLRELLDARGGTKKNPKRSARYSVAAAKKRLIKAFDEAHPEDKNIPQEDKIKRQSANEQSVHDFIISHKNDIYRIDKLASAVRRRGKNSKLTAEEEKALMNMYESDAWHKVVESDRVETARQAKQITSERGQYLMDMYDDLKNALETAKINGVTGKALEQRQKQIDDIIKMIEDELEM